MPIDPADLDDDPHRELERWLRAGEEAAGESGDAFALATADANGAPSVRIVLLRGLDANGLRFYTNRSSRKGRDLAANPRAAAVFHWPSLGRQVRVAGAVQPLTDADSLTYWNARPRASRLSAWASVQGSEVASRRQLEERVVELDRRFPGEDIPLPPFWGGYLLTPTVFEFWEGREDRLHDRVEYIPDANNGWRRRRLQP
jgi:pyridoxamine 5'-phosphate oxidase